MTPATDAVTSFRNALDRGIGTPATLRVLIVEDSRRDAELLVEMLSERAADGLEFTHRHVAKLADAGAMLAGWAADVVLLDLSLPDSRGLDSLAALRAVAPDVPVVVMTGLDDDAIALRAVQAGAQDYLLKGRDDEGAVRRAIRYAVERQRLVQAAREAARVRDEVLAIVSHDLRNPLSTIAMCAQALVAPEVAPGKAHELGGIIQQSSDWMQRLIGDLLDVARVETGALSLHVEPLPAAGVVDMLVAMHAPLAKARQVTLVGEVAPAVPRLEADADRLVQALGNLLGNALKFTPAGGRITIAAERADVDGHRSTDDDGGGAAVRFRVSDTGCGIAPENLARIFDRFWQVREMRRGGAGLGLAITKGIVEAHGGTIEVESTQGVGTTFVCTLPVPPASDAAETVVAVR